MVASRETLQDLAAERQLQPATLERVIWLIDILDAFGADTLIGPRIALKGCTALNVFHSDLDRLSVDIDVNYVGAAEKEQMDADRPGLEDRIARLMESKGYTARREPSEHAGGKWIYRYASALGGAGTIEIDINYLYRSPLYGVDRMPSAAIGSYRAANVPVLDRADQAVETAREERQVVEGWTDKLAGRCRRDPREAPRSCAKPERPAIPGQEI